MISQFSDGTKIGGVVNIEDESLRLQESQNPTVQKEAIRPIESAPTTIPPRPYPHNPIHFPKRASLTLRVWSIHLTPQVFGMWEETGASGGNPHRHGENVPTPHRQ